MSKAAQPEESCPWCGNTALVVDEISPLVWAVCCNECGCMGPIANTEEWAIDKWDERARVH